MKLYKKQIRPVAIGGSWQGCNQEVTPLDNWMDILINEENVEKTLKEKWTEEKMYEVTHARMTSFSVEYRYVEYEGIIARGFESDIYNQALEDFVMALKDESSEEWKQFDNWYEFADYIKNKLIGGML